MADKSGIQCLDAGRTCGPQRRLEHRPEQAASTEGRTVDVTAREFTMLEERLPAQEARSRLDRDGVQDGLPLGRLRGRAVRPSDLGAQPAADEQRAQAPRSLCGEGTGHRARGGKAEWRQRHVAHEQKSGRGAQLRPDQRADHGARRALRGRFVRRCGKGGHPGGFARAQVNPALEPGLHAFLRESNLMTAHSRLTGGRDKEVPVLSPARPGRRARRSIALESRRALGEPVEVPGRPYTVRAAQGLGATARDGDCRRSPAFFAQLTDAQPADEMPETWS